VDLEQTSSSGSISFDRGKTDSHAPGRLYSWSLLGLLTAAYSACIVDRMAWANVSSAYASANALSPTAIGSFFSAFFVGSLITTLLSGFVADWLGGKRVVCTSLLLLGILTTSFGFTTTVWAGLVVQAAMGFVAGADYSACVKLISGYFLSKDRATAIGIFLIATPLSLVIANLAIPTLMSVAGWSGVYQALGLATFTLGLAVLWFVKDPPTRHDQVGQHRPPFGQLVGNPSLLLSATCGFFLLWGVWGFAFWANALLVKSRNVDPVTAGFVVAIFGFSGIVAKPLAGWVADHVPLSKFKLMLISTAIFTLGLVILGRLDSITAYAVCIAVMGLSAWSSAVFVATSVVDSVSPELAGSASGLSSALWNLGFVIVPIVVGGVYQWTSSFEAALQSLAAGPAVCVVLALIGARRSARPQ